MNRRERTRRLIELGGLVVKAGLVDVVCDDRAMLYGALLSLADRVREQPDDAMARWGRRGHRAFEEEAVSRDRSLEDRAMPG